MKDLLRTRTSLSEDIELILNAQCKMEAEASQKYLAMAAWLDRNGFKHAAEYMYEQAEEERAHFLKIFKYITEVGGVALTPIIDAVPQEYDTIKNVFETALQSEIAVTQAIHKIIGKCRDTRDYTTEQFMMWYVDEQKEEEVNARRALELFELIDVNSATGKYQLDKAIGHIRSEE